MWKATARGRAGPWHARSGDGIAIAAYLAGGDSFDRALATFTEAYAERNERDHHALVDAVSVGWLPSEELPPLVGGGTSGNIAGNTSGNTTGGNTSGSTAGNTTGGSITGGNVAGTNGGKSGGPHHGGPDYNGPDHGHDEGPGKPDHGEHPEGHYGYADKPADHEGYHLADATGLTSAYSTALRPLRRRGTGQAPGRTAADRAVMVADGGEAIADLAALRDQGEVFGPVASTPTAWRLPAAVDKGVSTRLAGAGEIEDVFDAVTGRGQQVGPDSGLAANVLANRLERTAMQVSAADEGEPGPGRDASLIAVIAASFALAAQLHADHGGVQGTRKALGGVAEAMVDVLRGVHALRVAIGDGQGSTEE
ncbi:hypothetical protein STANM337S_07139 [Streptomyces tanashiensis]